MKKTFTLIAFCFTVLTSCEKEDSENGITISNITSTDSGVVIEWNKAKTNDFGYYEVLRSYNGVSFQTANDIENVSSPAYDVNATSFNHLYARGVGPDWKLYYKVAVIGKNGDEIMVSKKVATDTPQPFNVPLRATKAFLIPDKKQILFFSASWNDSHIFLYDYVNNNVLQEKKLLNYSSGSYGFGKYGDTYEFYFHDGFSQSDLQIIDIHAMQAVATVPFNEHGAELISDDKGHIYFRGSTGVVKLDRATLTTTPYSSSVGRLDEISFSADKKSLYGLRWYPAGIWKMQLDDNGNIVADTHKMFDLYDSISLLPGSDYAMLLRQPYGVINLADWSKSILTSPFNNFSAYYMKEDVLYASSYIEFLHEGIFCYAVKDTFRLVKTIPIRTKPHQFLIDDENNLIIIHYSIDTNNTIIDKIKLVSY